ncbi:MAG: UvrD-helicase domain-containing protein, partial [Ottowia sp.]|nr:UvrD-helicase domain-containing protein [Ottowia sp.]
MNAPTLNPAQRDAVEYLQGPCLVLAGAGSGKTRVIAHKIARLLRAGTPAEGIAAITFTNKAAAEMRERTRALAGADAAKVTICTFHALGVRLLREDGQALGLGTRFSIMDASDALALLRECGPTTDAALARHWQSLISRWKGAGLTVAQAQERAADDAERRAARVMARYQERLAAYQSVDFDDLIALPLRLLQEHADVAQKWRAKLAYILIDEYQDTSAIQYALLRQLVGSSGQFTAVGDDDQSIYGWRGATLDNLRRLPEDFPDLRVIRLETNYRSTAPILQAANSVIAANPKIYAKTLHSAIGAGEPVRVLACMDERHEAAQALSHIQALRARHPQSRWNDFAILYRANHQAM